MTILVNKQMKKIVGSGRSGGCNAKEFIEAITCLRCDGSRDKRMPHLCETEEDRERQEKVRERGGQIDRHREGETG